MYQGSPSQPQVVPVLVVDSKKSGYYDTIIPDMSTSWQDFTKNSNDGKIDLNYHENENGDLMHANGLYYDPKRDVIFVSVNFYSEVYLLF